MGDFDPRLDKWGESEFSSLGQQFKDSILNKGRVKRKQKAATAEAKRRARWKHSQTRRSVVWLLRSIGITLGAAVLLCIPLVLILNIWL